MFAFAIVTYAVVLFTLGQFIVTRYGLIKATKLSTKMLEDMNEDPFDFNDHTEDALRFNDQN